MNILFITKLLPYPLDAGGKVRTYKILKILSKRHKIHLVSFVDSKTDLKYEHHFKSICEDITTFVMPITNKVHKLLIFKYLCTLFTRTPFTVFKYYSRKMKQYIQEELSTNKYDILFIDHINIAQYIPPDFKRNVICDEHDISSLAFQKYYKFEKNLFLKYIYWFECKKLIRFEKYWLPRFDHILSISQVDRDRLIQMGVKRKKVSYIPTPFNTHYCYNRSFRAPVITFIGLLSWLPNEVGLDWFIKHVLPIVTFKIPNIKLLVVGNNGKNLLCKYKKTGIGENIKYLGYIKDINFIYKQSCVFVVPILIGGGIRIKLLEALSHGIPVVSTLLGSEGIDLKNKFNVLIENEPKKFAEAIVELLMNRSLSLKISRNGYKFIINEYSENSAIKALGSVGCLKNH